MGHAASLQNRLRSFGIALLGYGEHDRVDDLSAHRQEAGLPQDRLVGAKQHLEVRRS
jgi:hypothetical protein